jgi:hypothetical protein
LLHRLLGPPLLILKSFELRPPCLVLLFAFGRKCLLGLNNSIELIFVCGRTSPLLLLCYLGTFWPFVEVFFFVINIIDINGRGDLDLLGVVS